MVYIRRRHDITGEKSEDLFTETSVVFLAMIVVAENIPISESKNPLQSPNPNVYDTCSKKLEG